MTLISRGGFTSDTAKWDATRHAAAVKYAATKVRKPLAKVSKNRAAANRRRKQMLREMFPEPETVMCAVPGCCRRADDAHEPLTRARGGSIEDPSNIAPLCRPCHRVITDTEPAWAYEAGLLRHSWEASA